MPFSKEYNSQTYSFTINTDICIRKFKIQNAGLS
jgi:hypothetical protein